MNGESTKPITRDPVAWLAMGVAALALLRLAFLGHGLRLVCFDDAMSLSGWNDPVAAGENLDLDYSIGRFYASFKFAVLGWLQAATSPLGPTLVRSLALLAAAAGVAWFCARWTGRRGDALTGAALFLAAYPFYEGYQAYFSNPLLLVGLGAICASAALLWQPPPPARAASLGMLALALVMHEMFILFVLLHLAVALRLEGGVRPGLIRRLAPEAVIVGAYLFLNFALRACGEPAETYAGARLSLQPLAAINSLLRYTITSFPGVELWFDRASAAAIPARGVGEAMRLLAGRMDAAQIALSMAAGVLVYLHLARAPLGPRPGHLLIGGFLLILVILPNVLPALTPKYQVWALQRRMPYYYGVMGLGFAVCWLLSLRHSFPRPAAWLSAALALVASGVVFATQAMNAEVVVRLGLHPVDIAIPSSP